MKMSELFEILSECIPLIIFIVIISSIAKKAKKMNKNNSSSQSIPQSKLMSDKQLRAINESNRKEVDRVKRAAEYNREKNEFKPLKPSSEYDLSKSNSTSVGHSNQKDALNVKTSAKGVNVGQTDFSSSRMQLRREMEDRSHDWLAQQLRYEKSALRNNGLDLGYSHDVDCAAEKLKKSHHDDCEDKWIDDGEF